MVELMREVVASEQEVIFLKEVEIKSLTSVHPEMRYFVQGQGMRRF